MYVTCNCKIKNDLNSKKQKKIDSCNREIDQEMTGEPMIKSFIKERVLNSKAFKGQVDIINYCYEQIIFSFTFKTHHCLE